MARKQPLQHLGTETGAPTTLQLRRQTRLFRIARALASGATVTEIAEAENISRASASKHVNSTACRQLMVQFVNDERELMLTMFYRALRVIEHGFSARREYLLKDGRMLIGGPDHYARLSATKHFREFVMAGRPIAKEDGTEKRTLTLQELEEMARRRHEDEQGVHNLQ